jgi:hypothetical protein
MSPRGAALEFTVAGVFGARSLEVSVERPVVEEGEPVSLKRQWDLRDGESDSVNEALRKALTEIHDIAGNALEPKPAASKKAVEKLLTLGYRVHWGLFRDTSLDELQHADRFRSQAAFDPAAPPRVIEVSTPLDYGYPFELLRWHTIEKEITEPARRIRALLGMSAIMRRRLDRVAEFAGPASIGNAECLSVSVFQHPDLKTGPSEADYLRRARNMVDVYGPWPSTPELPEMAAIHHVLDSGYALDRAGPTVPAAVLHFACHTDTTSSFSDNYTIDIGGEYGRIELGDLKASAAEPAAKLAPKPRPLVFLNTCGSAVPHLASRVSFPEFFLDRQSLGVVGALCDISDDVAAHFAAVFYEALLKGRTIGEAIYDARWHLMDRHGNPLGLLYTVYGNPDLKVAHPRPGGVVPACPMEASSA